MEGHNKTKSNFKGKRPDEIINANSDNELVKYDNELNTVPFKRFRSVEMSIFFAIVSKMRDKNLEKVRFPFSDLRKLSRYAHKTTPVFIQDLKKTYHKMLGLTVYSEENGEYYEWVLFTGFHISQKHKFVDISVNPEKKYILNDLSNWTRFSLQEFNKLKSSYTKTIFRLCKQWRTYGGLYLNVKKFRDQLNIPKSYKTNDINRRILKPAKKELKKIWPEFDYDSQLSKKRGHRLVGYWFIWTKEARNKKDILNVSNKDNFAFIWEHKKTSNKIYAKERPKKIGQGKKVHKTSNKKAYKAYKEFKDS